MPLRRTENRSSSRFPPPNNLKALLGACVRASSVGIAVLDSQTRFESINASLAREMRLTSEAHLGRTSCELVGDVARPMESVHERVLSRGRSELLTVEGCVRGTSETGYWLNHSFPIVDGRGRVRQLGLFVVNVTAEKASTEIFDALATDSKYLRAKAAGLVDKLAEAVKHYQLVLGKAFEDLACPFGETSRRVASFQSSIDALDDEIRAMRELVYTVVSQFGIPEC